MALPYRLSFLSTLAHVFSGPPLPLRKAGDTLNRRRQWAARDSILLVLGGTFGRNVRPGEVWTCLNCARQNNSSPRCTKCGEERGES